MSRFEELVAQMMEQHGDELNAAADEAIRTGRVVVRHEHGLVYLPDNIVIEEWASGRDFSNSGLALVRDGRRVVVFCLDEVMFL